MRKKIGSRECSPWAHGELTVSSWWPKWSQPAVTEPWPGPWLSCDLAVTDPWSYWRCRDWAVTEPWLSCDLAVTELWLSRDWAVTSPSRDWIVIIGPRNRDHRGHRELTVSSPWTHGDHLFSRGQWSKMRHLVSKWKKDMTIYTIIYNQGGTISIPFHQPLDRVENVIQANNKETIKTLQNWPFAPGIQR